MTIYNVKVTVFRIGTYGTTATTTVSVGTYMDLAEACEKAKTVAQISTPPGDVIKVVEETNPKSKLTSTLISQKGEHILISTCIDTVIIPE